MKAQPYAEHVLTASVMLQYSTSFSLYTLYTIFHLFLSLFHIVSTLLSLFWPCHMPPSLVHTSKCGENLCHFPHLIGIIDWNNTKRLTAKCHKTWLRKKVAESALVSISADIIAPSCHAFSFFPSLFCLFPLGLLNNWLSERVSDWAMTKVGWN